MAPWLKASHTKPKLLLVDDQRINIMVLYELFREECEVFMATDGEQALQLSRTVLPDLILLDVHMEGLDGHQVCHLLKENPETSEIPIIFVTAQGAVEDEVRGFELGAVDFIVKPINPVIVKARVNTHLTLKRQSDTLRSVALLDGLTGVANRRMFDERLERDWRQCLREQALLSIIMIVINRPYDLLARYGGEEFVCVLPNTPLEGAVQIAERMRVSIEALGMEHLDSQAGQTVTISLGVAAMVPTNDAEPQTLIAEADDQLYQAKQAGRARVCFR